MTHALGVLSRVLHELIVQSLHAEVVRICFVLNRQEALVLGVQQEDEA